MNYWVGNWMVIEWDTFILKSPLQNIARAYDLNDFGWGSRKRASCIA